jgi:hypothetical protein
MGRRVLSRTLVVVGTLVAILAILAIWVGRQALETDQWTETSSELLEDPAIQATVADFLVDRLYASVDVEAELREALPPRADPLAGPAAGALRRGAEDVARRALERPEVQQAWEQANRQAHEVLVRVVEGDGDVVTAEQGVVTLDLKALLDEVVQRTGIGTRVASRIPADAAEIQILQSDELESIQTVGNGLKPLAIALVLAMLACFGGAIALATGRRRETLRGCGFGLILAGATALVVRTLAGGAVVDELAATAAVEPAVQATWDIGTSFLVGVATATIAYGVFVVLGAWLAGPTRLATGVREVAAPYLRNVGVAYGALAAVILLVLLWGPTEGTRRLLPAVVLIALTVAGFEVLRRRIVAEFPDAVRGERRLTLERARDAMRRVRTPAPAAAPEAATPEPAATPAPKVLGDDEVAQLERLSELHRAGGLDDDEFATAKQRVLTKY